MARRNTTNAAISALRLVVFDLFQVPYDPGGHPRHYDVRGNIRGDQCSCTDNRAVSDMDSWQDRRACTEPRSAADPNRFEDSGSGSFAGRSDGVTHGQQLNGHPDTDTVLDRHRRLRLDEAVCVDEDVVANVETRPEDSEAVANERATGNDPASAEDSDA